MRELMQTPLERALARFRREAEAYRREREDLEEKERQEERSGWLAALKEGRYGSSGGKSR